MSEFFVRRPIVAIVIAILMTLIGGVCILALPIAQYPQIAPPEIQVQTHYTSVRSSFDDDRRGDYRFRSRLPSEMKTCAASVPFKEPRTR